MAGAGKIAGRPGPWGLKWAEKDRRVKAVRAMSEGTKQATGCWGDSMLRWWWFSVSWWAKIVSTILSESDTIHVWLLCGKFQNIRLASLEQVLKTTIRQITPDGFVHFFQAGESKKRSSGGSYLLKNQIRTKIQAEKVVNIILISGSFSRPFLETGLV